MTIDLSDSTLNAELDDLAVEVAVVDKQGVIVAVNNAWEQFASDNGGESTACSVGASYLAACDAAPDEPAAVRVASVLRSALRGDLGEAVVVEIPCHSPTKERWFDVTISARTDKSGENIGATIMLTAVTTRRHEQLTEDEARDVRELRLQDAITAIVGATRYTTSIDEVHQAIAEGARLVTDAESAVLDIVDGDRTSATTVAAAGINVGGLVGTRTPLDTNTSGDIRQSGETVVAVPLQGSDEIIGVLSANTTHDGRTFTDPDVEVLTRYASIAALSLETAERILADHIHASADPHPPVRAAERVDLRPLSDLEEAEAWTMVESSPDGMILADEHGTMLLVNAQIESLFGYDRGELLGRSVEELLPDRHRQIHTAHRTRYRAEPKPRVMGSGLDLKARRNDGTEFPVEVSLSPVSTPAGLRVVATVRDISDRIAAEAFNHTVQHAINATHDGLFMFTPDSLDLTYVNDGASRQLGYSRTELLAMTPLHFKPEFTEIDFRKLLEPLIEGVIDSHVFSTVHRRKDGHDLPVEIVLEYPPAVADDQPRVLVALVRDITERVAALRALEASEAAFRTAFDAGPVGMAMVDFTDPVRRPISDCNQALCDFLGYSKDELLTKGFADLTHPDDAEESYSAAQSAAVGSVQQYALEKRYVHADGHGVWAWVHSAVLPDADGNPTRGMVHVTDLSVRKKADVERERSRLWLEGLAAIRAAVLSDLGLEQTLELVCSHARKLIGADTALIARPDRDAGVIRAVAYDSPETRALLPDHFVLDGPLQRALDGETFLSGRLDDDERVDEANRRTGGLEEVTGAIVVPIIAGSGGKALLMLSHRSQDGVTRDHLAVIESFADEAATALELHAARQAQARLEVLQDRERLAQDLHDLVIQRIFAAGMGLQSVVHLVEDPKASARVADTVSQLDETIAELRSAIFHLNSPDPSGVADKLRTITDLAGEQLDFRPILEISGNAERIGGVILEHLYPTLTEALANIARHADASAALVSLTIEPESMLLTVSDDGRGVDPKAVRGKGLNNIESRARRLNGTATIINNPDGIGALLRWQVPL